MFNRPTHTKFLSKFVSVEQTPRQVEQSFNNLHIPTQPIPIPTQQQSQQSQQSQQVQQSYQPQQMYQKNYSDYNQQYEEEPKRYKVGERIREKILRKERGQGLGRNSPRKPKMITIKRRTKQYDDYDNYFNS